MDIQLNLPGTAQFLAWAGGWFKLSGVSVLSLALASVALGMFASLAGMLIKTITGNIGNIVTFGSVGKFSGGSGEQGATNDMNDPVNEYLMMHDIFGDD